MKRISLILASLVLVFGTKASAFTGGPFDNGDYSALLDNSGIYQVSFRFSNGSGFAQFGTNVDTALFADRNSGQITTLSSTYSVNNRSIFYYKGVSYLGTCTGMVDHEAKIVQGVTNSNSDVSTTATNFGGSVNATSGTAATSASTSLLNNGGQGLSANSEFHCKITKSYPILRFSGSGEFTVLNPSIGQIVLNGLQGIITGTSNTSVTVAGQNNLVVVPGIGNQISSLLDAILANQNALNSVLPTTTQIDDNSDSVRMTAFGSRIFGVSRR